MSEPSLDGETLVCGFIPQEVFEKLESPLFAERIDATERMKAYANSTSMRFIDLSGFLSVASKYYQDQNFGVVSNIEACVETLLHKFGPQLLYFIEPFKRLVYPALNDSRRAVRLLTINMMVAFSIQSQSFSLLQNSIDTFESQPTQVKSEILSFTNALIERSTPPEIYYKQIANLLDQAFDVQSSAVRSSAIYLLQKYSKIDDNANSYLSIKCQSFLFEEKNKERPVGQVRFSGKSPSTPRISLPSFSNYGTLLKQFPATPRLQKIQTPFEIPSYVKPRVSKTASDVLAGFQKKPVPLPPFERASKTFVDDEEEEIHVHFGDHVSNPQKPHYEAIFVNNDDQNYINSKNDQKYWDDQNEHNSAHDDDIFHNFDNQVISPKGTSFFDDIETEIKSPRKFKERPPFITNFENEPPLEEKQDPLPKPPVHRPRPPRRPEPEKDDSSAHKPKPTPPPMLSIPHPPSENSNDELRVQGTKVPSRSPRPRREPPKPKDSPTSPRKRVSSSELSVDSIVSQLRSPEWDRQNAAAAQLTQLCKSSPRLVAGSLRVFVFELFPLATSIRTALSKTALECIKEMASDFGPDFAPFFEAVLNELLVMVLSSKVFISRLAAECVNAVLSGIPRPRALEYLSQDHRKKPPPCRVVLSSALYELCGGASDLQQLCRPLGWFVTDAHPDARKNARNALTKLDLENPSFRAALNAADMDASDRKACIAALS